MASRMPAAILRYFEVFDPDRRGYITTAQCRTIFQFLGAVVVCVGLFWAIHVLLVSLQASALLRRQSLTTFWRTRTLMTQESSSMSVSSRRRVSEISLLLLLAQ